MQAVILSGGVGSRLWPVSTKTCPKPFIITDDGLSLIQKAFLRASNISSVDRIITVANRDFVSQIKDRVERQSVPLKRHNNNVEKECGSERITFVVILRQSNI